MLRPVITYSVSVMHVRIAVLFVGNIKLLEDVVIPSKYVWGVVIVQLVFNVL
jgi:hypothetical protein